MRDFSKVSPSVWRSKKFRSLGSIETKHVYLYILTCPHGNSAGCFDIHPMYACADLGITEKAYNEAIHSLCSAGLIECDEAENTILIINWDEFNEATNPRHAIGLLNQLGQASSETLKGKAFHAFLARFRAKRYDTDQSLRKAIGIFLKDYPEPISTETRDRDRDQTEIETRPDLDLDARDFAYENQISTSAPSVAPGGASGAYGTQTPTDPDLTIPAFLDRKKRALKTSPSPVSPQLREILARRSTA